MKRQSADTPGIPAGSAAVIAAPARPWKEAAFWLIFLGPFFFGTYGFTNWLSAQRGDVSVVVWDWERFIPFYAWTVVPYWTIDLFYAASVFVCRDRGELRRHVGRLVLATAISCIGFLIWPLRFSFIRPPTDGIFGWLFDVLLGFDLPFNQAPSLHISLLIVLWALYAPRLQGLVLRLFQGWFVLIGISVLTTYQHHFIDVITGFFAGAACLYLVPQQPHPGWRWRPTRTPRRRQLALRYAVGGLIATSLALLIREWAWLLLWPAVAMMLVALGYYGLDTAVFQKHAGRRTWAARVLLWPYHRVAAWACTWQQRGITAAVEVTPGVWLGARPDRQRLEQLGIHAVVDLCAEFDAVLAPGQIVHHVSLPWLDLVTPSPDDLLAAAEAIEAARRHGTVLVHCALGRSRSALAVAAWIARQQQLSLTEAIEFVRQKRPEIVIGELPVWPAKVQVAAEASA